MRHFDVRHSLKAVIVTAIAVALVADAVPALQTPAQSETESAVYELNLVYVFEAPEPEFVFVVGNSGFKTVASLQTFIASLPAGTTLKWSPGCERLGGEPLLSSESEMAEFKSFCLGHQINFVLVPSG